MMMAPSRPGHPPAGCRVTADGAQALALTALAHLLCDTDRAVRFCAATGLAGGDLPPLLEDAAFLGGVLDFVLDDEVLLAEVAAAAGLAPEAVARARRQLPGAAIAE